MIKIAKFGGSSVATAEQFKKVKNIITSDESRKFVVVSATGKRFKDDNKVTDLLYLCHAHIKYSVSCDNIFSLIEERYRSIKEELKLDFDLESEFVEIRSKLNKSMNVDYLVSRGEYLTAKLMSEYLGFDFVDAKDIIKFNYDGSMNFAKTQEAMDFACNGSERMVIPGFYGALPDGTIKIMSRGGSDITGSIIAKMIHANVYENWTDVSGMLMGDPRIIDNPRRIEKITYSELRELSYMGANVLHEEAIFPVKEENIPINIRNTNEPDNPGTIIVDSCEEKDSDTLITGIAGKKDFTIIGIYKNHMSNEVGIIKRALEVFEKYNISIEHIPSGIDSFSVVVSSEDVQNNIYDIIADIKKACQPTAVKVFENIALIATVGRNMVYRPGIAGKLFAILGENDINIRMIAQGSDEINIIVGVENKDFEKTIKCIYDSFNDKTK
ncbi:MAG: aspartate kinase [Erysipelotrichaceae bacterium]